MIELNNLGAFASLADLWQRHPEGGLEGDVVTIAGIKHQWNAFDRIWENSATYTVSDPTQVVKSYQDLYVEHDLVVGGTLYAKSLQNANCGLFRSEELLRESVPAPKKGFYALVGDADEAKLFLCETEGEWTDSGRTSNLSNVSVDVSTINEKIKEAKQSLTQSITQLSTQMATLSDETAEVGRKADEALERNEYSDEDKEKVARLMTNGLDSDYLGADGRYHTLPKSRRGGGFLNITQEVPLEEGFYTLETALEALASLSLEAPQRLGLIITFLTSEGWRDYRYTGGVEDEQFRSQPLWTPYAPEVSDTHITELIRQHTPEIEVATSLDETNRPIASSAVKAELDKLGNFTFDADKEITDEGTEIALSHEGREVVRFTVAGGGGGSEGSSTKTVLRATLPSARIKLGDKASLQYEYSHYADGDLDGTKASLSLRISRGREVLQTLELGEVASGTHATLDLSPYLTTADAYSFLLTASFEENGTPKERKAQALLSVVNLSIDLYNLREVESHLSRGGYSEGDTAHVIVSVRGGAKELSCYIDGTLHESRPLSGSGGRQTFSLPIRTLSVGAHAVEFVASLEGLRSNSLYLDILKAGAVAPFVGLFFSRSDGALKTEAVPTLLAHQYEGLSWAYIAVDVEGGAIAELSLHGDASSTSFATPRTYQKASLRPMDKSKLSYHYSLGYYRKDFAIEVIPSTFSDIGIKEGFALELLARGRSNHEAEPNNWGGITTFEGVDFASSGWTSSRSHESGESIQDDYLHLINGAKAVIAYKPFERDAKTRGLTINIEARMTNVRKSDGAVISCLDTKAGEGFKGFVFTPSRAKMPTGGVLEFRSEEGETLRRELGLDMPYASERFYNLTLVVHPESDERTIRLYIDGVLSKADTYQDTIFAQSTPQGILLDSEWADLDVRLVRIYETALTDDEVLRNYITDRPSLREMQALRERNDVMHPDTGSISYDKLRERGKAVLTLTMEGGIERLWGKSVNTKEDFTFTELVFRSPYGRAYDLRVTDGIVRRQGTSTSTYPIKNLRIYLQKSKTTKVYRNTGIDGADTWELVSHGNQPIYNLINNGAKLKKIEAKDNKYLAMVYRTSYDISCHQDMIVVAEIRLVEGSIDTVSLRVTDNKDNIYKNVFNSQYDSKTGGWQKIVWQVKANKNLPEKLGSYIHIYAGQFGETSGNGIELRNVIAVEGTEVPTSSPLSFEEVGLDSGGIYRMRPHSKGMNIINLKTDYADSSLCYNTGTAILLNDHLVARHSELRTPGMKSDPTARIAIDGMPIDLFTQDHSDDERRYAGQFQFNFDKSKSGYLFGQTKKDGTEIALEFINNTNPVANFRIEGDVAEQLARSGTDGFDASVEFLYPEKDYTWNNKSSEKVAPENIKQAVIRLWQFIKDCVTEASRGQVLSPSEMNEAEVKRSFVSAKFRREVAQYFDVRNLTLWWVMTDYHMSVDQRVKNTFFRTWGDGIWWLSYYDGDTAFGKRNDAFLAYDYNINRDTRDAQRNKFAFEGHDSFLWCLVLANLEEELKASAKLLRSTLTDSVYLKVFNQEIMHSWSERQYNKSGIYKYIEPTHRDYNSGGVMNYIFALGGTMEAYRNQLIQRRFSLLDAKYSVGQYESDVITGYIGKGATATEIQATAGDEYYFAWKTQNGKLAEHQHTATDAVATFHFPDAMSQNDPIRLIGASRMKRIDLSSTAPHLQGAWNFNACRMLLELIAPVAHSEQAPTQFYPLLGKISGLRIIDLTGQSGVTGTESEQAQTFDVSTHSGLRELKLQGTSVRAVKLASGSPLVRLELPQTLNILRLKALPKLRSEGLVLADWTSVRSLDFAHCPLLDWQTIVGRATQLERLRVEGVDFEDDGTLLNRLKHLRGLDASGSGVDTCELVGVCQLTKYIDDEEIKKLRAQFPSLDIRQPEYTVLVIDDTVADPSAITNLDNNTGYGTGQAYEVSGHIKAILKARYQCVGKLRRGDHGASEMHVCRLDVDDSTRFYDGSPADVLYADGDTWVYEPEYWYKGVNDLIKGKKYLCFAKTEPRKGRAEVLELERCEKITGCCFSTTAGLTGQACLTTRSRDYDVYKLSVEGYKKVRVPFAVGNAGAKEGGAFVDEGDNIVERLYYGTLDGHLPNMYLIFDIPEGAKHLYFQVSRAYRSEEMKIVLSRTDKVLDLEPSYCHHRERLVGAYACYMAEGSNPVLGSFASSNYNATVHVYNKPISYFRQMLSARGLSITDYDSYKHIGILLWAKYGTRKPKLSGASFSIGSHSANTGMNDIEGDTTVSYYMSSIGERKMIWNRSDRHSSDRFSSRFMGYARMFSNHQEFMEGLTIEANVRLRDDDFQFTEVLDGSRKIQIASRAEEHLRRIVLGLNFDPLIAHRSGGTNSTYYSSWQNVGSIPSVKNLVLTHGGGIQNNGAVGYTIGIEEIQANNITARPMYYGKIVEVQDIEAYKRIPFNN